MIKIINSILLFILTVASTYLVTEHQVYSQVESQIEQIDFQQHFDDLGITGAIIIYDRNEDFFYQHNPQRNDTPFLPASTYKISHSLIALETGVIKDDVDVLTWDGIKRDLPQWNQDLNLRLAFKYSAVWFYQVLARRIGHQQMQDFVTQMQYGNGNIGAATDTDIDRFWLEGELRITPRQQVEFLRRLDRNDLPFSQRSIDLVKDIAITEQTPNYTLRAKTGWATEQTPYIGWYVGYLEQNDNVYFFATNLDTPKEEDLAARLEITRLCLQDLGLL